MYFTDVGAVRTSQQEALIGLTDLLVVDTSAGPILMAVTRGDGYLTGFSVGSGQTSQQDSWAIPEGFLQLETTDLVVVPDGQAGDVLLVGLNSPVIQGLNLTGNDRGDLFSGEADYSISGVQPGTLTHLELFEESQQGLGAVRGGGLIQLTFGPGGSAGAQAVIMGGGLQNETVSALTTTEYNGQNYAFVSYGARDTVAVLREGPGGEMQYASAISAGGGFWVDQPGEMVVVTAADGRLYVVLAASGSGSLSVLELNAGTGQLTPVDHVLDGLDTRFADASHVTAFEIRGQDYILASGSDSGMSVFAVLPGGRLHLIDTIAGSAALPLDGITDIEVLAGSAGAQIWVATEAAPYLLEFSLTLDNPGGSQVTAPSGGSLTGGSGNDILAGQDGADTLNGGGGDDILLDGAGADRLTGGSGADTFIFVEDVHKDTITDFQPGIDHLDLTGLGLGPDMPALVVVSRPWGAELHIGNSVIDVYRAGGGALDESHFGPETLIGLDRVSVDDIEIIAPPSSLTWLPPPDIVFPAFNSDFLYTAGPDRVSATQQADYLKGGGGNDTLQGLQGADTISGDYGNDTVWGGAGNDMVFGGAGFDTLNGESGNDTLIGGDRADRVNGGDGADVLLGGAGLDTINGNAGEDRAWAGADSDRVDGGDGNDFLSGDGQADTVLGGAGNDTLFGGDGPDVLTAGQGDDWVDGGSGNDQLWAGAGDQGHDHLTGGDGNDTLGGGAGNDTSLGGDGADVLYGGTGADSLFGDAGVDTIWAGPMPDLVDGGASADTMGGGPGADTLIGGAGADIVYAFTESDFLRGDAGDDTLFGGDGDDTILGGSGDDELYAGAGSDVLVFGPGHGNDSIGGFETNGTNLLDLSALSLDGFGALTLSQTTDGVVIQTGAGTITLWGTGLSEITSSDFIF